MNLNGAIIAHSRWRARLEAVIDGREQVDPAAARRDDTCDPGKWLHAPETAASEPPELLAHIGGLHTRFHQLAGDLVELAQTGHQEAVRESLALTGDYTRVSGAVIRTLRAASRGEIAEALAITVAEPPVRAEATPAPNLWTRSIVLIAIAGVVSAVAAIGLSLIPSLWVSAVVSIIVFGLISAGYFLLVKKQIMSPLMEPIHGIAARLRLGPIPTDGQVSWIVGERVSEFMDDIEYRQRRLHAPVRPLEPGLGVGAHGCGPDQRERHTDLGHDRGDVLRHPRHLRRRGDRCRPDALRSRLGRRHRQAGG